LKVNINLQASMPRRRPSSNIVVGSSCYAPSGYVLCCVVLDYAVMNRCGGNEAGPDGVSSIIFWVLCAKCLDLIVISFIF
jgi:hypothetical protein